MCTITMATSSFTKDSPSSTTSGKENDIHALLRAAAAIASPMPKKLTSKKKESSLSSTYPAAVKTVADLAPKSSVLSLCRIVSTEDDGRASFFQASPGRLTRDSTASAAYAAAAAAAAANLAASEKGQQEDVAPLICREVQPTKKTETDATTAEASTPKEESSNLLKRVRQSQEEDFWAFTKKRVPQATKDRKLCSIDECANISVNNGVCYRHGAKRRLCKAEGCTLVALQKGVCLRHGAKHPRCSAEGCDKQAQNGGVCRKHGAKVKLCNNAGCSNKARKGGVCIKHGATSSLCSSEGCANQVMNNGVCYAHGAKRRRCTNDGCPNQVVKGGLCHRHRIQATDSMLGDVVKKSP